MLNFRDEKLTFEETPLGLVLKGEEISSSLTDLGQSVLDPPDLPLVPESVLADELELLVEALLLEGAAGLLEGLAVVAVARNGRHGGLQRWE